MVKNNHESKSLYNYDTVVRQITLPTTGGPALSHDKSNLLC